MGLTYNTGFYNAAAEHYGVDDLVMTKIPRQKFQFMVEITINETVPLLDESYGRQFIFHRVQAVTLPDYQYNLRSVNQYNRMRYVPTKLEITPSTITFYDTKDSQFQSIMQAYAQHYFHGHNLDMQTIASYDTVAQGMTGAFGAKAVPSAQRYFFPSIRIISTDTAESGRIISMFNCMITNVNHDKLDYSDNNLVTWSVQFQPEQVNIDVINKSTTAATVDTESQKPVTDTNSNRTRTIPIMRRKPSPINVTTTPPGLGSGSRSRIDPGFWKRI